MSPDDRTSALPRRLTTALGLLALSAALTSCGGSAKKADSGATPSPTPSPVEVYTAEQARLALLVNADLPAAYLNDKEYTHDDLPDGCPAVEAATAADKTADPTWVVTRFDMGQTDLSIDEEIGVYSDPAEAASILDTYTKAFATCGSWTATQDGGPSGSITIAHKASPSIGDKAEEFSLTAKVEDQVFGGDQYIVLVGNALVFVLESGSGTQQDDPTVNLGELTKTLVERLQDKA
jgi:hypothetical protein